MSIDRANFRRRLRRAIFLPVALTVGLALVILWQLFSLVSQYRSFTESDQILASIPRLQSDWIAMELGLGDYLQSGNAQSLAEFREYRGRVDSALTDLERQFSDQRRVLDAVHEIQAAQADYSALADVDIERGPRDPGAPRPPPNPSGRPPGLESRVRYVPLMTELFTRLTSTEQAVRQERRDMAIDATRRLILFALGAALALGVGVTLIGRRQLIHMSEDYERALELARLQGDELRRLATHDPLTGLANRRLFHERLDQALAVDTVNGARTAVLYIDLNGFKAINDRFGHAAGDEVLVAVAQRLRMSAPPRHTIARLGGDEFTVLAVGLSGPEDAEIIAHAIWASLAAPIVVNGHSVSVTASIGVAVARGDERDADALIRRSDAALYRAKDDGRSRENIGAD